MKNIYVKSIQKIVELTNISKLLMQHRTIVIIVELTNILVLLCQNIYTFKQIF